MLLTRDLLILCCFISVTVGADEENTKADRGSDIESCGVTYANSTRNTANIRIIIGQEAEKGAWPWMAEIYTRNRLGKQPACGAALISRSYVVTSGHCVTRSRQGLLNASEVSIRLGAHNLKNDKDGMNVNVTAIYRHEEYDPRTFANDIALLRLEHPVTFTKNIQAICLPQFGPPLSDQGLDSKNAYAAGWGTTTLGGSVSDVLIEMTAVIVDDKTCFDAYEGQRITITDDNLCTVGINGTSPCTGFGGSPVMLPGKDNKYYLLGIVSFGLGCGNPDYPDVSTRVPNYLGWIKLNMDKN